MIEKLKFLIDESEDSPKLKEILLKVAAMPEHKQEATLQLMEIILSKVRSQDSGSKDMFRNFISNLK